MKLPLDYFRLLGIKPEGRAASVSEVEQALMERLRNPPSEAYSPETLDIRAELLRAGGAFLTDERRYHAHQQQLAAPLGGDGSGEGGFDGIELEPGQEVAAPLLLLEARDNLKAFALALELLSRRGEAAALHGHQQADLLLMATLAARRASRQMWTERLYDQSAQTLERAIGLLANHASQARRKAMLEDDLNRIAPFRILDLLSQESGGAMERQRGLNSLKALIDRRGGLDAADDEQRSPIVFQDFFKQIRPCLTIEEQLELFEGYSRQGGPTATFLLAYTRAAAGFQRRQPAHVDAALTAMETVDAEGLEPEKACLLLLLGQPDAAQDMVRSCRDPRLCQWFASYPSTSDSLPGLCSFCSQWLEQQVLPCYRDVDPHTKVDLDAYFLDPEVQRYIKDRDSLPPPRHGSLESKPEAKGNGKAKETKSPDLFTPARSVNQAQRDPPPAPLPSPAPNPWSGGSRSSESREPEPPASAQFPDEPAGGASSGFTGAAAAEAMDDALDTDDGPRQARWLLAAKSALVVMGVAVLMVLRPWSVLIPDRTPNAPPPGEGGDVPPLPALPPPANTPAPPESARVLAAPGSPLLDLAGATTLLEAWLESKARVLETSPVAQLDPETLAALNRLATPEQVRAVLDQRRYLQSRGELLKVSATVDNVSLLNRSSREVNIRVVLTYGESTRNRRGVVTSTFGPLTLTNDYTFSRTGQGWQLLRFAPSPP